MRMQSRYQRRWRMDPKYRRDCTQRLIKPNTRRVRDKYAKRYYVAVGIAIALEGGKIQSYREVRSYYPCELAYLWREHRAQKERTA